MIDADLEARAEMALAREPNIGRVALSEALRCSDYAARTILRRLRGGYVHEPEPAPEQPSSTIAASEDGTRMELTTRVEQVRTLDEALAFFQVDIDTWKVDRYIINQWGRGDMMQVKAWLVRRVEPAVEDAISALASRLVQPTSSRPWHPHPGRTSLVFSLVDHHFGKLAWGQETGQDYDVSLAEALYERAVRSTLDRTRALLVEEIVFPIGNDLFHFDTARGRTANDTQMDMDTRPAKVFVSASMAVIRAIETAAATGAKVKVKYVPGNHDPSWSHHLCVVLWAYFKTHEGVEVDFGACPDKLYEYRGNLIYFTHGDISSAQMKSLPLQLATLHPEAWARAHTREILTGHWHFERETSFLPTQEYTGTLVRILPSLCGTDHWHFTKGFKGNQRASLSFIYGEAGLEAIVPTYARTLLDG